MRPSGERETAPILHNLLLFIHTLRQAGFRLSPEQTLSLTRALPYIDLGQRDHFFFTCRTFLVTRREDLRLFEILFHRFWRNPEAAEPSRPQKTPQAPRHDRKPKQQFNIVTYMAYKARQGDVEIEVGDRSATYSDAERLQNKDFSAMTDEELATVKRLIQEMRWQANWRRTRRRIGDSRGANIDLRRTLRETTRTGNLPPRLPRFAAKIKRRPIVLLADISGSMEKYSRLMLLFFHSVRHSLGNVEAFVFATRLSRITHSLAIRNVDRALDEASSEVEDWAGGTRIGESLHAFNRRWGRRVLRRGALVVLVSDGWERGKKMDLLAREMRHLQHRCHRLIWLNPLLGKTSYEPLVEGMAVALPFIDDFLPIHNLHSLRQLAEHLGSLPMRRSAAGTPAARQHPSPTQGR